MSESVDSISTMCTANNLQTEKLDEEKWKCVCVAEKREQAPVAFNICYRIHTEIGETEAVGQKRAKVSHKFYSADLCGGTN